MTTEGNASGRPRIRDRVELAALLIGVALIFWLAYQVLHGMAVRAASGEPAAGMLLYVRNLILFVALVTVAVALSLARLLWRLGQAVCTQERFPPEGLPTLLEAEPRKGVAAIYLGRRLRRAAQATAVLGVSFALAAAWYALRL